MPCQLMRHLSELMRLVAFATLMLIVVNPTHAAAQNRCEAIRQSCTAECYARYFTIDPKRNECIAKCKSEESKCRQEQAAHEAGSHALILMQCERRGVGPACGRHNPNTSPLDLSDAGTETPCPTDLVTGQPPSSRGEPRQLQGGACRG